MKTAGLALDFYDDVDGSQLKKLYPTQQDLPESVKVAHILNEDERSILRPEAFAVILLNEGKELRKFACVDEGNTLLSVQYFEKNHDKLPVEAVKVAASNLMAACLEYDLEIPNFLKMAAKTGMARNRDPMRQPTAGDDADWSARTNLLSIQGNSDSGKVQASASNVKVASAAANRYVDVSGLQPVGLLDKTSSVKLTALDGKYPLDSFSQVEQAIGYFQDNWTEMDPADRHQFCVKTAARAEDLGVEVPEMVARYGSEEYAPDLEAHISSRKSLVSDDKEMKSLYSELLEKKAEINPEEFAKLLQTADEAAGLNWFYGHAVSDPYLATFGGNAAKEKAASWKWSGRGAELDSAGLSKLASAKERLKTHFDDALVDGFCQDPVNVFESLPDTTKVLLANLAKEF
jgi:hypothetical protein